MIGFKQQSCRNNFPMLKDHRNDIVGIKTKDRGAGGIPAAIQVRNTEFL